MRCPKCQYLGFDGHTRCRNCGYDLSLAATAEVSPPPSDPSAVSVAPDLSLRAEPSARERARAAIRQRAAGAAAAPVAEAFDLPLFATPGAEDLPVVAPPPVARAPLSVRRPAGDTPRPRAAVPQRPLEEPRLELDLQPPELPVRTTPEPVPDAWAGKNTPPMVAVPVVEIGAPLSGRVLAGLVDAALLLALGAAVVASTLRAAGLPLAGAWRLPVVPLAAFLALLAVGYLTMCTVLSGQTAGKALFGLQVVEVGGRAVRFGPALVRAVIQVVTVPLIGFGFLPAALASDRRALYDRLTNTEVIRTRR